MAQRSTKSTTKGFLFSNVGIKHGKMGAETLEIALNAHVHLRAANQHMSRPGARFSKVPVTLRAQNQIFKSKYKE